MGAIGGVVDFRNCNIDFTAFKSIKDAQTLRGRKSSVAYIDSGVGMFYNSSATAESPQPMLSERRGYKTALVIDNPFSEERSIVESYRTYGVEFVGMLDFSFAMALYDGERRMLLLARDKNGRKPLYYSLQAGKVFFSSEPKGVLAINNGAVKVNADMLSLHLTSPMGIYNASNIYTDIFEVQSGECILFTELGVSRFFYRRNLNKKIALRKNILNDKPIEAIYNIDKASVITSLEDSLVAFDIPQFDAYMTSLCDIFLRADESRSEFAFVDYSRRYNLSYSYEREDRLSSFYGKNGIGVMARFSEETNEENEKMMARIFEILREEFFSFERNDALLLRKILGDEKMNCLLTVFDKKNIKKENTEQSVRILGMLYQAVKWFKLREIELLSKK